MTEKLKERIDRHLERIGEKNRSAWIRAAVIRRISQEEEELGDE